MEWAFIAERKEELFSKLVSICTFSNLLYPSFFLALIYLNCASARKWRTYSVCTGACNKDKGIYFPKLFFNLIVPYKQIEETNSTSF